MLKLEIRRHQVFKGCTSAGLVFCLLSLHENFREFGSLSSRGIFAALCLYYIVMNVFVLLFVAPPPLIDLGERRRVPRTPPAENVLPDLFQRATVARTVEWNVPFIRNYYRDRLFFPVLFLFTLLNISLFPPDYYVACVGTLISIYLITRILLFQASIRNYIINPPIPTLKVDIEEIWRYNRPGGFKFLKYLFLILLLALLMFRTTENGWGLMALGFYIYYECLCFLRLVVLQEIFTYYNMAIQNIQDKITVADNIQSILSLINNFLLGSAFIGYMLFVSLTAYLLYRLFTDICV